MQIAFPKVWIKLRRGKLQSQSQHKKRNRWEAKLNHVMFWHQQSNERGSQRLLCHSKGVGSFIPEKRHIHLLQVTKDPLLSLIRSLPGSPDLHAQPPGGDTSQLRKNAFAMNYLLQGDTQMACRASHAICILRCLTMLERDRCKNLLQSGVGAREINPKT